MTRPPITQANLEAAEGRLESSLSVEIVPTLWAAVYRLKDKLIEARQVGRGWDMMAEDLKASGIDIEAETLRSYLGKIIRAQDEGRSE